MKKTTKTYTQNARGNVKCIYFGSKIKDGKNLIDLDIYGRIILKRTLEKQDVKVQVMYDESRYGKITIVINLRSLLTE
jgi:hypothetical protein